MSNGSLTGLIQKHDDSDAPVLLAMRAELVHILPFWMRTIPEPTPQFSRNDEYRRLAAALESLSTGRADLGLPYSWEVERLSWYSGEPDRIASTQQYRIRARVSAEWFEAKWKELLSGSGHTSIQVGANSQGNDASRLRYEEFGLGTLEYVVQFTAASDWEDWHAFLCDEQFWVSAFEQLNKDIDGGELPIQQKWPVFIRQFEQACGRVGIRHFKELEALRGERQLKPPARPGEPQNRRIDDICWTYNSILVLFRELQEYDQNTLVGAVSSIFAAWNGTPPTCDQDEGGGRSVANRSESSLSFPAISTSDGSLDVVVAQNMGLLAVVSEPDEHQGDRPNAPSRRVRAIWRQLQMNYAALTEATSGLQRFIEDTIKTRLNASSHREAADKYENLRRTTAALGLIRFRALPQKFEADDFEEAVYLPGYKSWGVAEAGVVLKEVLEEADRATSRMNDLVVQNSERRLGILVAVLAAITLLGVLHDVVQYLGSSDPTGLPNNFFAWFRAILLFAVAFGAVIAVRLAVRVSRARE